MMKSLIVNLYLTLPKFHPFNFNKKDLIKFLIIIVYLFKYLKKKLNDIVLYVTIILSFLIIC